MSEKVGKERLVHESVPDGQSIVSQRSDFEVDPGVDCEPIHSCL